MKYVDVIIEQSNDHIDFPFTYSCDYDGIRAGQKVSVPFSKGNKIKEGYVIKVRDELDKVVKGIKSISHIDETICLGEEAIATAIWMRNHFMCRYIEAINCFLPPKKASGKKGPFPKFEILEKRNALNQEQINCFDKIKKAILKGVSETFLLEGVTGSGKTEVYIRVCEECLKESKTAIVLVPEISLTPQTLRRFLEVFGEEKLAILHSKLTKGQRYDQWEKIRNKQAEVVIGARSAVFAPLENIGVIILDEEHESSYKSDMTPKYSTHEVAIKRAEYNKSAVILGTATPSINSYYKCEKGEYTRLKLTKRAGETELPNIEIVDMAQELRGGNKTIFSHSLHYKMTEALKRTQQIILFLNRRGYSSFISCRNCDYVMRCPECGISMTYHKGQGKTVCHYCGRKIDPVKICPECGSRHIKHFGIGTEQIVENVEKIIPGARCARLDLDAISKKGSLEKILKDFEKGKIDILVGTQIVAKGLHFENVGVVGIIAADMSLNIPDYRSRERTFQLITQASGRAGRGKDKGEVVVQTYSPENFAIKEAVNNNYRAFYNKEIALRKQAEYPPFKELIQIIVADEEEQKAVNIANFLFAELKNILGSMEGMKVFKAKPGALLKTNGKYRYQILIKCIKLQRALLSDTIRELKLQVYKNMKNETTIVVADIDPYSFI